MKKLFVGSLYAGGLAALLTLVYFTIKVVQSSPEISFDSRPIDPDIYRIVFISGDSGSPFWKRVKEGASSAADENVAAIEFKETFQDDAGEYLKNIEMAISSRVDGIIVQGTDDPEFIRIVNKALQKGIAVVTVFTDAPDSLRKTYVGPNHYEEGIVIGERIASRMAGQGQIGIVYGVAPTSHISLRKDGLEQALAGYPGIRILEIPPSAADSRRSSAEETNELLNRYPECKVFIGLTAEAAGGIVQVIKARDRIRNYSIYTFDENAEILDWIDKGILSATLLQHPEEIGFKSTTLILRWLEGKDNPLERNYYTPVEMIERKGAAP
ncbi:MULTISPECIES: substrate-binding domain-containing protein [unclassified Paenibacillus]|uniref:sugar ABC transporter substrate-binding protein n=1 Tax=unclassified Paenibacillus TaxID=185978 RepID=UPI001C12492B|nr:MULTISPECIES: substrate-binding domain-containing protein [unclassified Paenibacillus]MBU5444657.1 substrate-binding domain-containing protein [Paenibacillus sp. MSJ-34]CAH0119298.1 hypothetical protein PAE9249_01797 [Paenibacillus sp. CECT 9249]